MVVTQAGRGNQCMPRFGSHRNGVGGMGGTLNTCQGLERFMHPGKAIVETGRESKLPKTMRG